MEYWQTWHRTGPAAYSKELQKERLLVQSQFDNPEIAGFAYFHLGAACLNDIKIDEEPDMESALYYYKKAAEVGSKIYRISALDRLSDLSFSAGEIDESNLALEKYQSHLGNNLTAMLESARHHQVVRRDLRTAESIYRKILASEEISEDETIGVKCYASYRLGTICALEGRQEEAKIHFTYALKEADEHGVEGDNLSLIGVESLIALGDISEKDGNIDEAIENWRKALNYENTLQTPAITAALKLAQVYTEKDVKMACYWYQYVLDYGNSIARDVAAEGLSSLFE